MGLEGQCGQWVWTLGMDRLFFTEKTQLKEASGIARVPTSQVETHAPQAPGPAVPPHLDHLHLVQLSICGGRVCHLALCFLFALPSVCSLFPPLVENSEFRATGSNLQALVQEPHLKMGDTDSLIRLLTSRTQRKHRTPAAMPFATQSLYIYFYLLFNYHCSGGTL